MAATSSVAHAVLWNWVIEALANYDQVDTSTLIGIAKMAPAISGDLGKDTKEMVSLRILESLFLHGNESINNVDSAQNAKISFDPSEHCENVLQHILRKTHGVMSNLEKEKWDVGPFLMHKRSSLCKCMLKKLKDLILVNKHPLLASLKERGKLVIATENISPANDGNLDVEGTIAKDKNKIQDNVLQKPVRVKNPTKETTEHDTGREECEMSIQQEHLLEGSNGNNSIQNTLDGEPSRIAKSCLEHDDLIEISSNSERSDDERRVFSNSECTLNEDLLTINDWSEIDHCMKCNKGGELLVCSSNICPIRVHESCLGFVVTLDENGKFMCPVCACSRALLEYQEAKRKASMARKDLQAFTSFTVKSSTPNESFKKQSELEKNKDREIRVIDEKKKVNCDANDVSGAKKISEPSTPIQMCMKEQSESSCSRKVRKRKVQSAPCKSFPSLRRKMLPWTKAEEEKLKEGVQRYLGGDYKGIPWKEILDFGRNVFDKGRTPIDLKDKWRNLCKGSSTKSKKIKQTSYGF